MPSINEVIERANRVRPDAIDDATKAAWLLDLNEQLYRETVLRHEITEEIPEQPKAYPADGDMPLLVGAPWDGLYDLYLFSQTDFINRESANYNNSVQAYNAALDEWQKQYHRQHMPGGTNALKNVF